MTNSRLLPVLCSAIALSFSGLALPCHAFAQTPPPPRFGANLVVNGDAEAGTASDGGETLSDIPGWTREGKFDVVFYGVSGGASATDPGPNLDFTIWP